jgi:hypothetical protein
MLRRTTSGATGNDLSISIRYLRGAAGIGLGTTIRFVLHTASSAAGNGLGSTIKYLRRFKERLFGQRHGHRNQVPVTNDVAAGNGLGTGLSTTVK